MNNRLQTTIFLVGLLFSLSVFAQHDEVQARVDISVRQDQEIWSGQQVTVNLDLKTTGFSFSETHFNLPEVGGAFLMQTDTTTIKLSEKTDGRNWQILRYPLALYPQKAGQIKIPPIDVRFNSSAGFGSTQKAFAFQTKPLELTTSLPPGVTGGGVVITTTSFKMDHNWQPAVETAHTGDAFTLTVTRHASDISAMLLPPLPVFQADGLAVYPQTPEINDRSDRGDLIGERIDSIIWVLEKPGNYHIPGIRFQWWNPDKKILEQQIVPGLNLDVFTTPTGRNLEETGVKTTANTVDVQQMMIIALAALLAAVLWWFFGHHTRKRTQDNEKSAFASLQKACRNNHAGQAYSNIHTWLEYCFAASLQYQRPLTLEAFGQALGEKKLVAELEQLQRVLVIPDSSWQGSDLARSLRHARRKINKNRNTESRVYLTPLNP